MSHIKQRLEILLLVDLWVISSTNWSWEYRRPSATFVRPFNPPVLNPEFISKPDPVVWAVLRILQVVSEPLIWYLLNHSSSHLPFLHKHFFFYLSWIRTPHYHPFYKKKREICEIKKKKFQVWFVDWWWKRKPAGWGEIQPLRWLKRISKLKFSLFYQSYKKNKKSLDCSSNCAP